MQLPRRRQEGSQRARSFSPRAVVGIGMQLLRRRPSGQKRTPNTEQSHFTIRVSGFFLTVTALLLAVTVGWAFVMGFIVGRGENPGERLARYDPFARLTESASTVKEPRGAQEKAVAAATETPVPEESPPKVAEKKAAKAEKGEDSSAPHPFMRPKGESFAAWGEDDVRLVPKKEEKTPEESSKPVRSEYFYQVASYRTKNEAEKLAKQLSGPMRKSYVEQNGSLYSVYLNTKANEGELSHLKTLFEKLRIKGPKLMAKKDSGQAKLKDTKTPDKKVSDKKTPEKKAPEKAKQPPTQDRAKSSQEKASGEKRQNVAGKSEPVRTESGRAKKSEPRVKSQGTPNDGGKGAQPQKAKDVRPSSQAKKSADSGNTQR